MGADPSVGCLSGSNTASIEECAREIYQKSQYHGRPGAQWDYNSMHLQIALAIVAKRMGLTGSQILEKYVYTPANMINTYVDPTTNKLNPVVSAGMHASGDDYDSFLRKYLANELLPEALMREFEKPVIKTSWGFDFAMAHRRVGDELSWGGTIMAIVNRRKGYYVLMMLPYEDYLFGGQIRGKIWNWIKEDVQRALSLLV